MLSGKTTRLMEEAVYLLAELSYGCQVFITGPHTSWTFQLEKEFKAAGLVDVEFFTPDQIIRGKLRGRRGVLLIDDIGELSSYQRDHLYQEQRILKNKLGI